ncbi:MAG: methyl-accepting chemotaxis protein [Chromatiales bacterium]|nr:methyl-accepting chemotaxis protein [Chromatiales bacterium]
MKINHPVSNREKEVQQQHNILSTTDLKGAITYVNQDFVEISGFSDGELCGHNHNVVRHPDMPPVAFESLWDTVKAGYPWMGIVKNRCKNGDHYWVDAFVMPILKGGETFEYQSVRYQPKREWIERAERIYQRLQQGKGFKSGLLGRIGLRQKLILGNLLALLPALLLGMSTQSDALGLVGFAVTGLLMIGVNALIMHPLQKLVSQASEVYDQPVMRQVYTGRDDEFGQIQLALKMQSSQINAIVGRLSDTTSKLSNLAHVNYGTSVQANQGVEQQQQELSMVATAMTQMVATVQEIARNTVLAAEATRSGQKKTVSGQDVVQQTVDSINALSADVQQAAGVIDRLSKQSADIVRVLDVIKDIAEQTNLLALNAAIEAARAGENGRGFAVVADEVRNLASRTTQSAKEIEEMIERLQSGSSQAVGVMEQSCSQAESCVTLAGQAGAALQSISGVIDSITDMNHHIATASEEQSSVAEEINQNIVNINQVADSTSEGAHKSVRATEEMAEAIERLDNLVLQFKR